MRAVIRYTPTETIACSWFANWEGRPEQAFIVNGGPLYIYPLILPNDHRFLSKKKTCRMITIPVWSIIMLTLTLPNTIFLFRRQFMGIALALLAITPLHPFNPAASIEQNTPFYFEISPVDQLTLRLREFYTALAGDEQADIDLLMVQQKLQQSLGINPFDMEEWGSIGFDTKSPIGFVVLPSEVNSNPDLPEFDISLLMPATDSEKLYRYFYEIYRHEPENTTNSEEGGDENSESEGASGVVELEEGRLFHAVDEGALYFLRLDDGVVMASNLELIERYKTKPQKALADLKTFQDERAFYDKANTDASGRILLTYINFDAFGELEQFSEVLNESFPGWQNGEYLSGSGALFLGTRGLKLSTNQTHSKENIDNPESFAHQFVNYKEESPMVDFDPQESLLYLKYQMNYPGFFEHWQKLAKENNFEESGHPIEMVIDMLIELMDSGLNVKSSLDPARLIDTNFSLNITEIPEMMFISNPIRYDFDISFNITDDQEENFIDFMQKLEKEAAKNEDLTVTLEKNDDKQIWKIDSAEYLPTGHGAPSDDGEEGKIEIVSVHLIKDGKTIYISSDMDLFGKEKKLSKKSYTERLINLEKSPEEEDKISGFLFVDIAAIYQYILGTPSATMLYSFQAYLENLHSLQVVQVTNENRLSNDLEILLKE